MFDDNARGAIYIDGVLGPHLDISFGEFNNILEEFRAHDYNVCGTGTKVVVEREGFRSELDWRQH